MTVLDAGGMLANLKEPVALPEGFDTTGIAELTDTLYSDLPIAMVRYKTGRAAAFNYLTGEEIKLAQSRGGVGAGGIIDYAKKLLGAQRASLLAGISDGYQDLRDYENLLGAGALPENATGAGGKNESGENSGAGEAGGGNATGESGADAGAGGAGGNNATGDGDAAATGGDGKSESDANGESGDTGGANASGNTGDANGNADNPNGDTDASKAAGADDSESAAAAAADKAEGSNTDESAKTDAATGDLSRPAPARRLVSMYNFESGAYEVYDENDLLTAAQPTPIATLDYADATQAEALRELAAQGYKEPFNRGLLVMLIVFGAIAALLVYLYLRRRRLTYAARKRQ
jgi:hypothetical protein